MSLWNRTHRKATRRMRPLGSLAISVAAVLVLTVLVGIPFLPHELRRHKRPPACILQHYPLPDGTSLDVVRSKEPGLRGQFIWEVVRSDSSAQHQVLYCSVGDPLTSVLDRNEKRLIVGSFSGKIVALDWDGRQSPETIASLRTAGLDQLQLSSSQRVLIASQGSAVQAICLATKHECWARTDLQARRVAIDERSGRLLVGTANGELLELDLGAGKALRKIVQGAPAAIAFAISRDGSWFTCVDNQCKLDRVDRANGQSLWRSAKSLPLAGFAPAALAVSPCNGLIVAPSVRDCNVLVVWKAATGKPLLELRGHAAPLTGVVFATDEEIRSWGTDGNVRNWRLESEHPVDRVVNVETHYAVARRARPTQPPGAIAAMRRSSR